MTVTVRPDSSGSSTEVAPPIVDAAWPTRAIAHQYHAAGYHPFPVDHPDQISCIGAHGPNTPCDGQRGKHPAVKWKTWSVSATSQMIDAAWARRADLANVGIACGPANLVVLDEDEAGELDRWAARHGITLSPTYEVTTGRGRHLYYRWDHRAHGAIGNSPKAVEGFKIDVRGDGGLVVAAGSRHASGAVYVGNGLPVADLSPELATILIDGAANGTPDQDARSFWDATAADPNTTKIDFGQRHQALVAYAGRLRRRDLDYREAVPTYHQRYLLCEQPTGQIPEARYHSADCPYPVTWDEAEAKLRSVYDLYPAGHSVDETAIELVAPGDGGNEHYFGRDGLQARNVAEAVMRSVTCGYGAVDQRLYVYDNGVYVPNDGSIEAEVARLLGNRYRNTHCRNVVDLIRYSPDTARITRDPRPEWINLRNCMLRWANGEQRSHGPEYLSTVQLPIDYAPDATCPEFEKYLAQVLPRDCYEPTLDGPGFIWELIGYALYSGNPLHVAILLYGNGRNGKGVLLRVLKRLIGERNCSTVTLHELVENRFRAATLYGKVANLAGDLDARWLDNTATFKAITGGDTIQGEHKYGAVFDFAPWALPIYSTNKAFGSADSSEGWVARWVVVPFPMSFVGREDRGLDARIQSDAELRGILRRAVDALPALMKRGRLPEPDSVREAKQRFIVASDAVRSWLDDQCAFEPDAWTDRTLLYAAYARYTHDNGAKLLSAREFYSRLEQVNGLSPSRQARGRGFKGVKISGQ